VESLSVADAFRQALWISMISSMPILVIAMVVGLVIGILQTATSIQEQTLLFIPKILAVIGGLLILGPWMGRTVVDMARFLFQSLHRFVS
jgi:flagellar biosynthetic protein FliQ